MHNNSCCTLVAEQFKKKSCQFHAPEVSVILHVFKADDYSCGAVDGPQCISTGKLWFVCMCKAGDIENEPGSNETFLKNKTIDRNKKNALKA